MSKTNDEQMTKPLETKRMVVSADGKVVHVGTQKFKRVVLPSVAVKQPEAELNVLDDYG